MKAEFRDNIEETGLARLKDKTVSHPRSSQLIKYSQSDIKLGDKDQIKNIAIRHV